MAIFDTILNALGVRRQTNNQQTNNRRDRNTTGSTVQSQASAQAKSASRRQETRNARKVEQRPTRSFSNNTPAYNQRTQNRNQSFSANIPSFNNRQEENRRSFSANTPAYNQPEQESSTRFDEIRRQIERDLKAPKVNANNVSEEMFGKSSATKALADTITDTPVDTTDYSQEQIDTAKQLYSARQQHILDVLNIDANSEQGQRLIQKTRENDEDGDDWTQYLPKETDKDFLIRTGRDVGMGVNQFAESVKGLGNLAGDVAHSIITGDSAPDIDDRDRRMYEFNQMALQHEASRTPQNLYDNIVTNLTSNMLQNNVTSSILGPLGWVNTPKGEWVGRGVLGGSSFGNAYRDMRFDEGATVGSAALYGLGNAANEILQESISVPGLPNKVRGADVFGLGDIPGEFAQEAFGQFLDPYIETLRTNSPLQDPNAWMNAVGGQFGSDFLNGVNTDRLKDIGKAGLQGAISSGASGMLTYAGDSARQIGTDIRSQRDYKELQDLYNQLMAEADEIQQIAQEQQSSGGVDFTPSMVYAQKQDPRQAQTNADNVNSVNDLNAAEADERARVQAVAPNANFSPETASDDYVRRAQSILGRGMLRSSVSAHTELARKVNAEIIRRSTKDLSDGALKGDSNLIENAIEISNRIGIPFTFANEQKFKEYGAGGVFARASGGKVRLSGGVILLPNNISKNDFVKVFMHEVMHTLEGSPKYNELTKDLKELELYPEDWHLSGHLNRHGTERYANLLGEYARILNGSLSGMSREGNIGIEDSWVADSDNPRLMELIQKTKQDFDDAIRQAPFVEDDDLLLYDPYGVVRFKSSEMNGTVNEEYADVDRNTRRDISDEINESLEQGRETLGIQNAQNHLLNGTREYETPSVRDNQQANDLFYKRNGDELSSFTNTPYGETSELFGAVQGSTSERSKRRSIKTDESGNYKGEVRADEVNKTKLFPDSVTRANADELREANAFVNAEEIFKLSDGAFSQEQIEGYLESDTLDGIVEDLPNVIKANFSNITDQQANAVASQLIRQGKITEKQAAKISPELDSKRLNDIADTIKLIGEGQQTALEYLRSQTAPAQEETPVTVNRLGLTDREINQLVEAIDENDGVVNSAFVNRMVREYGLTKIKGASHNSILNVYREAKGRGTVNDIKTENPRLTRPNLIKFPKNQKLRNDILDAQKEIRRRRNDEYTLDVKSETEAEELLDTLLRRLNQKDFYELRDTQNELAYRVQGKNKYEVISDDKGGNRYIINTKTNVFTGQTLNDYYASLLEDLKELRSMKNGIEGMVDIRLGLNSKQTKAVVEKVKANGGTANAQLRRELIASGLPLENASVNDLTRLYRYKTKSDAYGKELNIDGKKFKQGEIDQAYRWLNARIAALSAIQRDLRSNKKKTRDARLKQLGFEFIDINKELYQKGVIDETYERWDEAVDELQEIEKSDAPASKKRKLSLVVLQRRNTDRQWGRNQREEIADETEAKPKVWNEAAREDFVNRVNDAKEEKARQNEEDKLAKAAEEAAEKAENERRINFRSDKVDNDINTNVINETFFHSKNPSRYVFGKGQEIIDRNTGQILRKSDGTVPEKPTFKKNWQDKYEPNKLADRGVDIDRVSIEQNAKLRETAAEALDAAENPKGAIKPKEYKPKEREIKNYVLSGLASSYANGETNEGRIQKAVDWFKFLGASEQTAKSLAENITDSKQPMDSALIAQASIEMATAKPGENGAQWYAEKLGEAKVKFFEEVQAVKDDKKRAAEWKEKQAEEFENQKKNYKDKQKKQEQKKLEEKQRIEEQNQEAIEWGERRRQREAEKAEQKAQKQAEEETVPTEEEVSVEQPKQAEAKPAEKKKNTAKTETGTPKADQKQKTTEKNTAKEESKEKKTFEPTPENMVEALKGNSFYDKLSDVAKSSIDEALEKTKAEVDGAEFNSTLAQMYHRFGSSVESSNALAKGILEENSAEGVYDPVQKQIMEHTGMTKDESRALLAQIRRTYKSSKKNAKANDFASRAQKVENNSAQNEETSKKESARKKAKESVKKASETAKKVKGKDFTAEEKKTVENAFTAANEKQEQRAEETAKKVDEKIEADKKAESAKAEQQKQSEKAKKGPKTKTKKAKGTAGTNSKTNTQQEQTQTNQQESKQEEAKQEKTGEQIYDETIKTGEDRMNYSKDFSANQTVERLLKDKNLPESFKQRLRESYLYKAIKHDDFVRKNAVQWLKESGVEGAVEYAKYVENENGTVNEEGMRYMIEATKELNAIANDIQREIDRYEKAMEDNGFEVSDPGVVGFKKDGKHVKEFTDKNGNVFNAETWEALKDEQHKRLEQSATISTTMLEASSESARILRVMRTLHDNPLTAKTYLEKVIARLNRIYKDDLTDRKGNVKELTLDSKLSERYLDAKTDAEREKIMDEIEYAIADQLPRHAKDMIRQWRMTMMLVNPKTHMRNIMSNYLTKSVFRLNDVTQSVVESALVKAGVIKETDRRAAIVVKDQYMKAAEALDKLDQYSVEKRGEGDKFNLFDAKLAAGAFSNKTAWGRFWNAVAKKNMKALEYEDYELALKGRAHLSMAMILQSGGYTVETKDGSVTVKKGDDVLTEDELKTLERNALQDAQESTFHDANAVAKFIESLKKRKYLGMAIDVVVPFTKTPANILRRSREFSPIGLLKAVSWDLAKVHNGEISASTYVTRLSRGITGTGLYAIGFLLANMGLLSIPDDDDEEGRESYYRNNIFGKQDLALHVGDRYYSIDWAMPTAAPIMMGAAIAHTYQSVKKNVLDEPAEVMLSLIKDTAKGVQPVLEASYLNSIEDIFSSMVQGYNYGGQWFPAGWGALERFGTGVAENFAGQMTPTLGGAINRTFDAKKRTTSGNTVQQRILNRTLMNLPGGSLLLEPAVDEKGNELNNLGFLDDGFVGRALYNGLFPSNITKDTHDELDSALMDVGAAALPRNQTGSGGLKGQIYADLEDAGMDIGDITNKEYTQVKKTYYGNYREYAEAYNELAEYNRLGTHTRDGVYKKLEQLALNEAKATYYDKVGSTDDLFTKEQKVALALKEYGVSPAQFFLIKDNGLTGNRKALYVMSELENLGIADDVINDIMHKKYFPSDVGLTDSVVLKTADEREEAREKYLVDDDYETLESQVARYHALSTEEYEEKQKEDKEKSKEESWEEFFEKVDKKYGTSLSKGGSSGKSGSKGKSGGSKGGHKRSSKGSSSGGGSSSRSSSSTTISADEQEMYEKFFKAAGKALNIKGDLPSASVDINFQDDSALWDKLVNASKSKVEKLRRELGIK